MEIYALLVLVVLNGFFAMSEIALVSARRARLQALIDKGDAAARIAADPLDRLWSSRLAKACSGRVITDAFQ